MKKSLGLLMSILMIMPTQSHAEEMENADFLLAKSAEIRLELVELANMKNKAKKIERKEVFGEARGKGDGLSKPEEITGTEMEKLDEQKDQIIDVETESDSEDVDSIIQESEKLILEIDESDENIDFIEVQDLEESEAANSVAIKDEKLETSEVARITNDCANLEYKKGAENTVFVRPGFITDISLGLGENLERITLGNSTLFEVNTYLNSSSDGAWHIYINPAQKNVETNMIIISDRRSYQVRLVAGDLFFPFVKWNIQEDIRSFSQGQTLQNKNGLNLGVKDIRDLHSSYARSAKSNFRWAPTNVFDDKHWNTYFYFESGKLDSINPMVFAENSDGVLIVVPYEKVGDILVIKAIYSDLIMKYGSDVIKFHRK